MKKFCTIGKHIVKTLQFNITATYSPNPNAHKFCTLFAPKKCQYCIQDCVFCDDIAY